jgi:hypothetical protein
MSATLKLTHKAIGVEIRRGTYEIVVDGTPAGSVELNETVDIPVDPGHHTLRVRNGRNSSPTKTFDAAEGETVAFRCSGKSILPIFLLSFIVPSLALSPHRELAWPERSSTPLRSSPTPMLGRSGGQPVSGLTGRRFAGRAS